MCDKPKPNACGPRGLGWLVPDLVFKPACDEHDKAYWAGGSDMDRANADRTFYDHMLELANTYSWWKRWWYRRAAWLYYQSVRLFGKAAWRGE